MSLCGTNDDEQLKIELLSQWKLEAEFRNMKENLRYKLLSEKTTFLNRCNKHNPRHGITIFWSDIYYIISSHRSLYDMVPY